MLIYTLIVLHIDYYTIILIYTLKVLHIDYYTDGVIFIAETSDWRLKHESILDSEGAAFLFAVKMCFKCDYTGCRLNIHVYKVEKIKLSIEF